MTGCPDFLKVAERLRSKVRSKYLRSLPLAPPAVICWQRHRPAPENSLTNNVISERTPTSPQKPAALRFPRLGLSQVWVRFLLAIVGLMLAFGCGTVFHRVARGGQHLGNRSFWPRSRCCWPPSSALTTVPYLARRVVATRVREAMDYDVTRAGLIYILISVVIGIAAINTGNNLLYVVVAALLSAILVSGIASALVLRSLTLDVHLPEHVFAGRPMLARLLLRNASSWLPSFSVRVVPAKRKTSKDALALGSLDLRLAPQSRASGPVAPPARPPLAARARGSRKAHPARIRLFSFSRSRTGTPRRPGDQLPSSRPLLRKKTSAWPRAFLLPS